MIAVTGASGNLGRLVIKGLVEHLSANEIIAVVRNTETAKALLPDGVIIREGDYTRPETLRSAFRGAEKVPLISAVVPGQRLAQHKAVIDAAKEANVKQIAYTSMLRADTSDLILAEEHKATEEYIRASGLPFTLLRNAWYLENHTGSLRAALQHGAIIGAAGQGRFASASRADYAGAAVTVLTKSGHENKVYELAGDTSYDLRAFATEVSRQVGREILYTNLSANDYRSALLGFGLPEMIVQVVVDADIKASNGGLDSSSRDLQNLIGRPTTTFRQAITTALND